MPKLGLTVDEAIITEWLVAEGEAVAAGDPIVEIETDKAVSHIEAPQGGVLVERSAQENDTIQVGQPVAYIDTDQA